MEAWRHYQPLTDRPADTVDTAVMAEFIAGLSMATPNEMVQYALMLQELLRYDRQQPVSPATLAEMLRQLRARLITEP